MDYAKLLEEDINELNRLFIEVLDLQRNYDNWRSAKVGELYGVIDIPVIGPSDGRSEDVRTGFELQEVAIEMVLIAIAPTRVEASSLGARMALELKDGIKKLQAFAAPNLKMLDNLSIKGEIPIKKDQTPQPPRQWLVQVAASGTATIALYKNAQGESIAPPTKYDLSPRILQTLQRIDSNASNS